MSKDTELPYPWDKPMGEETSELQPSAFSLTASLTALDPRPSTFDPRLSRILQTAFSLQPSAFSLRTPIMLDIREMYGKMCVMRTATIRDAQHHFSALIRLVQRGEEIEVLSRRIPVARIVPARPLDFKSRAVDWSDHGEKLKKLWKGKKIKGSSTSQLLDELRGER